MADSAPSKTPFTLPQDVHVLAHLRDQLGDYLSTLERNTDSIRSWLEEQQNKIIVGHHQLVRAITQTGDEKKAVKTLESLGETAGFILNLQDFTVLARTAFGADSALEKALSAVPRGVPADILEDMPAIRLPKKGETVEAIGLNTRIALPEDDAPAEKKGFWSSLGGMFKGEDPEEEARRKAEAERRHWRRLRSDLISLQSDRHYYIDSFMDWVGENLEPETPQEPSPALLQQYENPQYVIDLAQRDYNEVNQERTKRLNQQALEYSALAQKLDQQDIQGFIALLPALFPRHETPQSTQSKALLLADFGVASFAELALTHVKKDEDRIALLSAALSHEQSFKIAGLTSNAQIFERVLGETLKPEPLSPEALEITLKKLLQNGKQGNALPFDLDTAQKTPVRRITARFEKDLPGAGRSLRALFNGIGAKTADLAPQVTAFADSAEKGDPAAMLKILHGLRGNQGHAFMALWQMAFPDRSLTGTLAQSGASPKMLSQLTEAAITAGIHDEWRLGSHAQSANSCRTLDFLKTQIIGSLSGEEHFTPAAARKFIAHAFLSGGLDSLRKELTTGGLLAQVVSSPALAPAEKTTWVAALLEPYAGTIVRANILHEAAIQTKDQDAAALLSGMEAVMTGNNIRLADDKILTNLPRIANIWYNPDPKTLHYTIGGIGHALMENVSQHMADETLALIQRKGGFEAEYDGLLNPDNVDRLTTTPNGTKISWQRHTGDFNGTSAQAAAFHSRAGFIHETAAGRTLSINQKSVLLLQPLEDGTHLLIDKYGAAQILDGKVDITAAPDLTEAAGAWFNPRNASILSFNDDKQTLEFRAESKDFDDFLESTESGEYLYSIALPADAKERLMAEIGKDSAITFPMADNATLALNLRALVYLQFDNSDADNAGFQCHKYGPTRKPGFVHTEDAAFASALYTGMQSAKDLIVVENLIVHKDMIEDAYYNEEKGIFYILAGQEVLDVQTDNKTAYGALRKLAAEKGFETVGVNLITNPAPNGVGHAEVPADVINLPRATLIAYNPAQEHAQVYTDQDKYHIGLNRLQTRTLIDRIEKEGQAQAVKNTAQMPWVKNLSATLRAAPAFDVVARPVLTDSSPRYLLAQALGSAQETRQPPVPDADFSIAASAVKTGSQISYPHGRKPTEGFMSGANAAKNGYTNYRRN